MLGHDRGLVEELAKYKKLHVRLSIKGTHAEEYHRLTGATEESYELPFIGLRNLMDAGVSCNACVMISFSSDENIQKVRKKLYDIRPGLLKSLELERINMFPKVANRLRNGGLKPIRVRGAKTHGSDSLED